ncbi:MAG: hypothetical protein OEZ32_10675, partial [Nitrospinota bacterium]|nr:hypothetical protein [Nitrospinota bacterium]
MIIRNLKIKKLAVITGFIMLVLHVGKADCSDDVKHIFEILRKSISPTGVLATFDLSNAFTFKFKSTFGGMATMTVVLPDKYERGKKYDLVVYFPGGDGDPWQPYYFYQTQQNGSLKDYISNMDKILVLVKLNLPLQSKIDKNKRTLVNNFLDIDNGLKLVLNALENPGNIYLLGISFGGLYGSHYLAWRHRSVGVAGVLFLAPVSPIEPYVYRPLPELKIGFKEYF